MSSIKRFKPGWKPDVPDFRDYKFTRRVQPDVVLPPKVSLRPQMPPILNQGDLGSCTAFSVGTAVNYLRIKQHEVPVFNPSRLFIYYNIRVLEGTVKEDSGAEIRTSVKSVIKDGFCSDQNWPYVISKFKTKPPASAYKQAAMYKAVRYYRLYNGDIDELKSCLAEGFPFIFGFMVYSSYDVSYNNGGIIPYPTKSDRDEGGHAVVCSGYDDSKQLFEIHNSWGDDIGDKGYFYLPYKYLTNASLSDDFWTIRLTKDND